VTSLRRHLTSLTIAGSLFAAACGTDEAPAYESSGVVGVTTAVVQLGGLRDVANVPGMIVASSAADLTLYAQEAAEIAELPKKVNDPVAVGDVLVRFDIASLTQELAALQLEVIEASSRLDRARTDMTRQASLFERGITSRNTHDAARLEVSAAESGLGIAKARLDAVQAGQNRAVVRATFPGIVLEVWHQEGDAVRPDQSDPILRVADPTRVQVAVQLPVAQLARIVPGQTATVRAIAGTISEPATVVAKAQGVEPGSPTGEVRLGFVNPATLPLNTPVSAEILLDQRTNVLIVPTSAVARDDLGVFVMIAGGDNLAHRRNVRIGLTTPQFTHVAEGLSEGEQVILAGLQEVVDQSPIIVAQ
jgi:RND family efflux transporter MFP subunit